MRLTIRTKLTVIILVFILTPIAFLGNHIYGVTKSSLEERIGQEMRIRASAIMEQIERMLVESSRELENGSGDERMLGILKNDSDSRTSEFLKDLKKQHAFYSDLVYADNRGVIVAASNSSHLGKSVGGEFWFKQAFQDPQIKAYSVSNSQLFTTQTAFFAAPVFTDAILKKINASPTSKSAVPQNLLETLQVWKPKTLGVLIAYVNWEKVVEWLNSTDIIEGEKQSQKAYALLMDRQGLVLSQPFFEERAVMFHENLIASGLRAAGEVARGRSGYTVEKGRTGEENIIAFTPSVHFKSLEALNWTLLVFESSEKALAPIRLLQRDIFLVGLLVALLASIVSVLFTRGISRPIEKLAEFTKAVGQGDLSNTVSVTSTDEVGILASSFNDMIRNVRKAKSELTTARDYATSIIKSIVDVLVVVDHNGLIKTCNSAVLTVLGFEENELIDRSLETLFTQEDASDRTLMESIRQGRKTNVSVNYRTRSGETVPMLLSSMVLKDVFEKIQGAVVIAKDMRDYKNLEQQFFEAQKMDALGRLSGSVAHDFNNMLMVINGYSEKLLRKMGADNPAGGELGIVLKAGKKAARLTTQLLAFSRRQVVKPIVLNINELVFGMTKMLKLVTGSGIELVVVPGEGLWAVKIDAGQFEQVLTNLTVNARDSMPDGGKVILMTSNVDIDEAHASRRPGMKPGKYVLLCVEDTGTGIPEDIRQRIFEPFFTTKPKGKGTGLGLATCYSMVKQAEGYIDLESTMGKGTAFKIYFPQAEGKPQNLVEEENIGILPTGTETILLADDEDMVREYAARVLTEQGYRVLSAINGIDALKIAEEFGQEKIHLLLTDVMMPKMGGRELAKKMKIFSPGTKVLFMSGYVDDDFVQEMALDEKMAFLPKPITPTALAIRVRQILDLIKGGDAK